MAHSKYILVDRIAQGGMAEIHMGKSVGSDGFARIYAFKRILPHYAQDNEFIQMFHNEAMVAKTLQNKNIVQVFDFVSHEQTFMLVMELVDGLDLRAVLQGLEEKKQEIPTDIAVYIAIETLNGLGFAHTACDATGKPLNIVHRDVSPQNILLGFNGDVKVTDFGIAKAQNQTSTTRAGVLKGKFRYMSPEQAMGLALDGRTDLFAVGIILFEMLTMQRLFKGDDFAVLEQVRQCRIAPPSQTAGPQRVPPELDTILLKMLARNPRDRYQSALEAARDLTRFLYTFNPGFFSGELSDLLKSLFPDKVKASRERTSRVMAQEGGEDDPFAKAQILGPSTGITPLPPPPVGASGNRPSPPHGGKSRGSGSGVAQSPTNMGTSPSRRGVMPQEAPVELDVIEQQPHNNTRGASKVVGGGGALYGRMAPPAMAGGTGRRAMATPHRRRAHPKAPSPVALVAGAVGLSVAFLGSVLVARRMGWGATSQFTVNVVPGGRVLVDVNGVRDMAVAWKMSPFTIPLKPGVHTLVINRLGYKPREVHVRAPLLGDTITESVVLEKKGPVGHLRIVTVPAGGQVTLDEALPTLSSPALFDYIPSNTTYTLRITHPRCTTYEQRETLPKAAEGRLTVRNINLRGCK